MSSKFYKTGSESSESESYTSTESSLSKSVEPSQSKSPKSYMKSRYVTDFEEIYELGKGGYGKVFLCEHRLDRMRYAIKKIPFDEYQRENVLREVYALSFLHHKNIVRYHQAWIENSPHQTSEDDANSPDSGGEEDAKDAKSSDSGAPEEKEFCLFIQMEYCPLKLVELLEQDMDEDTALNYFQEILKGVSYMHQNDVIHRDLTAQNILLDGSERIKISDFGLAKKYKVEDGTPLTSAEEVGNVYYRAPEMNQKNSIIDEKVDIFSLGVILFELLYKFGTQSERWEVLYDLKNHGKFPACEIKDHLKKLILELLSKDPNDRHTAKKILEHRLWENPEQ